MDEHGLRQLIDDVRAGRLQRRRFVQMMVGLGLGAPLAAEMLASSGVARAQTPAPAFTPTRRGGGGPLKTLWWQAPTLLNPHFATGTKDQDASRIFYEPLAGFDPDGNITPILASEVPSVPAGTLARDLTWVVWRLKKNVSWHDGKPFTADDVAFTYEYASDPATAAVTSGSYREVSKVEKVDSHTVRVVVRQAPAVLGRRLLRQPRHDPAPAPVRALQGRQVPRGPDQPQAGGDRAVPLRRLQARRHRARRAVPGVPRGEPALLRRHRDEGRRRRRLGGAGRAPDRRVRLRLEHAGGGRHPPPPGAGRQGPRQPLAHRQSRAHPVQLQRPLDGGRGRAVERSRPRTRSSPTPRCARPSTSSWTAPRCRSRSTAGRGRSRPTS